MVLFLSILRTKTENASISQCRRFYQVHHHCCPILSVINITGMNQIRHHFLSDPVRHQHYGQEPGTSLLSDSTRQHYGQKPGHFDHHYCPILTVVNIIRDPRWGSSLVSHHCCLLLFVIKKH